MVIYTVRPGDTIWSIAARFGVPAERLILDNELTPESLSVGQAIVVTYHSKVHTVRQGDTLWSISADYGISTNQLYRNNPILGGNDELYPGQSLVIEFSDAKRGTLSVTGYVYTFVDESTLRKTLPYLTYLAIFSYGMREDGSLIIPDDEKLIALAKEYGAKPMLVLTSLGEDGTFSTERVSSVLNNPTARDNLIANLVEVMNRKGYEAINSDFEYIQSSDSQVYVDFIRMLRESLAPFGKTVDVSLAPKTSDRQIGLLYEGIDYKMLGEAADTVFLMTYEWGYTYSEPRAVAPIPAVKQVVDYAVGVIPRETIFMGMPNYGYDWQLPWVEGVPARSLSNVEAIGLANNSGAEVFYDETAETPWFRYFDERGENHEVWFEDARSVDAKLALANSENLLGIGIWNVTRWFPQLWLVLNILYNIRR